MIKARVATVSASRDDALRYLYSRLESAEWSEWKRASDISLTEQRLAFKAPTWKASTTLTLEETFR